MDTDRVCCLCSVVGALCTAGRSARTYVLCSNRISVLCFTQRAFGVIEAGRHQTQSKAVDYWFAYDWRRCVLYEVQARYIASARTAHDLTARTEENSFVHAAGVRGKASARTGAGNTIQHRSGTFRWPLHGCRRSALVIYSRYCILLATGLGVYIMCHIHFVVACVCCVCACWGFLFSLLMQASLVSRSFPVTPRRYTSTAHLAR